jgi:hypothetical protein
MAIDIRAIVTCNLGTLISGSLSDDYVQGNGLVTTKGSCQVKMSRLPVTGEQIVFNYTKNGITRRIPRALRVLSSFTDPYRRITTIEFGCKLTYLADLQEPINWRAFDDPANAGREQDTRIVTVPIRASSLMNQCLSKLGITASSNPLTNQFSVPEFSFASGYVRVLSDLLVSESFCGYLDLSEVLQVFSLAEDAPPALLISDEDLIDVGPIGVGELPADTVTVSFSSLRLAAPEIEEGGPEEGGPEEAASRAEWGDDLSTSQTLSEIAISYEDFFDNPETRIYNVLDTTETTTSYIEIEIQKEDESSEFKNVPSTRVTTNTKTNVGVIGNIFQQYLNEGLDPGVSQLEKVTVETFQYDGFGNQISSTSITTGNALYEIGSLGIDFVYDFGDVVDFESFQGDIPLAKTETASSYAEKFTANSTQEYSTWVRTIQGQQAIAEAREVIQDSVEATEFITEIIQGARLVPSTLTISTNRSGDRGQEAPSDALINDARNADGGDPDNGYKTESRADLVLVTGSKDALLRKEFSLPYAPDDIFVRAGNKFFSVRSDAGQKASQFGRIQNRMLLGNRFGMNIQISPEKLPVEPFAAIAIQAAGTLALYRVNGASWNMDANGIVASSDAMFWGTVGRI